MAFRQPTLQSMQRAVKPAAENRESAGEQSQAQRQLHQPLDQSQTWVLFAPATEGATTASDFSETIPSIQTTGRLQLSDIGSIHTAARSTQINNDERGSNLPSEIEEEDAELDRLDSHLPSFRSFPREEDQNMDDSLFSNPVFPQHDGLGLFNIGQPALGLDAQDQMYQFEKYNPRRVHLRRESLDLANQELDSDRSQEAEKRQRIEAWRLEHSRVLVEEIQRQTRRRRRSQASLRQVQTFHSTNDEHVAVNAESISDNLTWHDDDADVSTGEPDGLLARVTQKVIKDLLGIDDHLLSILFGESFPEDETLSSTPRALHLGDQVPLTPTDEHSWHERVANTVSREIGLLVNQISHHPGAFSSYSRIHQQPLPYAGLPVIPETGLSQVNDESTVSLESEKTLGQDFRPTIQRAQTMPESRKESAAVEENTSANTFTKEEWEKDLDVKLVFRYICSRFNIRASSPPSVSSSGNLATANTQDAAAKAARVRQHHPLTSRARPTERRTFKATTPSSPAKLRHQSSCASQSTRRSARRSSVSSRHYWDIGGSLGTGSMIASNGPMGSWGEL
jgi:hypothetical protein